METKKKPGVQRGHVISEETKSKMRLARLRNPTKYWLGKKMDEAHKAKLSANHKGMSGKRQPLSQRKAVSGENNWNWKGGITPLNHKIRASLRYKDWRSTVFHRDDYSCVLCGVRGVELNADHIRAFSTILREHGVSTLVASFACDELWDTDNGRTLCVPCHKATDNFSGRVYRGTKKKHND